VAPPVVAMTVPPVAYTEEQGAAPNRRTCGIGNKRSQEGAGDAVAEEADDQVGKRGTHPPNLSRTSENAVHAKFP
jgi:hypothetical protein